MRMIRLPTCVLVMILLAGCMAGKHGQRAGSGGLFYRSLTLGGVDHLYAYYVPRACTPDRAWPCVVFLNGSGECGTDGQRQLTQGLFPAMINEPRDWPMIAVFPQKPDRASAWSDHDDLVLATLSATQREVATDPSRIYLTGLSQGGAGAWAIGAKHPDIFAAVAPICGFGDAAALGDALNTMPIWSMHGEMDNVVPIAQTQQLMDAVRVRSGRAVTLNPPSGASLQPGDKSDLRLTRFPDLNHGCWDRAYRDMELGEWFLSTRR